MSVKGTQNYVIYVDKILGAGSTGTVHFARHKRRGDACAAKIFLAAATANKVRVKQNEIEFMQMLNHRNIVRFFAIEEESRSKDTVLLMELCTEGSLQKMLSEPQHVFGLREALFISFFIQFVEGLSYLTLHGVVHRDVKPGNILCSRSDDGRLVFKLTDFGATREMSPHVGTQTLYGTEEYLYPEIYRCVLIDRVALPAGIEDHAEMWSIGVTLYHVATGQLPFQPLGGRNNRATMYEIISTKQSGVISGVQTQSDGTILWSRDFPDSCPLSRGLRGHVVPIIAGAVDNNVQLQWKFDEFFPRCESFYQRLDVVVFCLVTAQFHHVYVHHGASLSELRREICAETELTESELMFVHRNAVAETETVGRVFPTTSEEFPVVVSSFSMATWRGVTRMKPALPGKPAGGQTSLAGDVTWSRDVTAYLYTVLLLVVQLCYAQNHFTQARRTLIERLSERARSQLTAVSDVTLTASTTLTNVDRAVEQLRRLVSDFEQRLNTSSSSSDSSLLRQLRDTLAMLPKLSTGLHSAKTDVLKRQSRIKMLSTSHITSDGPASQCQQERCVGRQQERHDKSHVDYVQFVDDKKRQQLSYNDEQIHKYRRLKLSEMVDLVANDVTQHCLRITDDQHQQLRHWTCDEFIKAYDDVTELEKSIQKLRALLEEALNKLRQVNALLKAAGEYLAENPDKASKSQSSSARSTINSILQTLLSSSSSSAASVALPAVSRKEKKQKQSSAESTARHTTTTPSAATTTTTTTASPSSVAGVDTVSSSSSSAELCDKRAVTSASAATLSKILDTQLEEVDITESIRHSLLINGVDRLSD